VRDGSPKVDDLEAMLEELGRKFWYMHVHTTFCGLRRLIDVDLRNLNAGLGRCFRRRCVRSYSLVVAYGERCLPLQGGADEWLVKPLV